MVRQPGWPNNCMARCGTTMNDNAILPGWARMSIADAHARMCAAGQPFEMQIVDLNGRPARTWVKGPKTLKDIYDAGLAFDLKTFIVHGGDRVSFRAFARATEAL